MPSFATAAPPRTQLLPVHEAQVLTYLKLTGFRTGLLVNFGAETLRRGLRRLTNK